jgi:alpha-beta hydrolase superfamily lysophospholipase
MASTLEAFMAGDGRWNGTAVGADGSINANFVFGYPADWIGTTDTESPKWTWQAETWSTPSVADAMARKFDEMYAAINRQVEDIDDAAYSLVKPKDGSFRFHHDPRVESGMARIGAFHSERFLTEPLHLHHSDQDYYSVPSWNRDLAQRINDGAGLARRFEYAGNTHSLGISEYEWFNDGEIVAGLPYAIERDLALFKNPARAREIGSTGPGTDIGDLRRYASRLHNEFKTEFEREPLDGVRRRVVSFEADGLRQFALIAEPPGPAPEQGWPVLLMTHGYHPNPPQNGRTEDGRSDRPGDYYRGLPLAYARQGFLVVWPDLRGHNDSAGLDYTQRPDPPAFYARDLVAAFRALPSLPNTDTRRVFLWGHSMGGNVVLRALQALGPEVKAASVWSTSLGHAAPSAEGQVRDIPTPLLLQHSLEETTVPADWSQKAYAELRAAGRQIDLVLYPGSDHLFEAKNREEAISRDIQFFNQTGAIE